MPGSRNAVCSYARWVARAKPGDYVIALGAASASLPLVGRHLEVLGGFAALGIGGRRYVSSIGARMARGLVRNAKEAFTPDVLTEALGGVVAAEQLAQPWPTHRDRAPFLKAAGQRRYVYRSSVRYGDRPGQLLDVWRSPETIQEPAPVLVFVPGGAWVFGRRELQGHALMAHLARRGWVCLSVQYGSSPRHRWPRQITDVKAAIAWARANAAKFGGDPNFVAVAGCSAGGHLATLAGLTNGDPQWQTDLPADADTSVDAVVSVYGLYDWHDRSTPERDRFLEFLERVVVQRSQARRPEVFRAASPMERVHSSAPPFLAIHGSDDGLIPVDEARSFVERLRSVSESPVCYIELPGVGHGFDLVDGTRTAPVVAAIGRFLHHVHQDQLHGRTTSAV
ncbi:alpha/beta hydrolase [Mycolicibacterium sphagni]|uniref:Esterase n=1 Tax=Mycolicibacterium sphagni TaxID=1786 RepID=A0A255DHE9_9MYCO|nr:alpha/beta hydrolase [Mycolicibacterium sphagni]MCV7177918.1 alpha/beta hydrolase [Mycolicibacterium sphagni]OYN76372.1 esterase [Mycolicibacterium sphagni]